MKIITIEVEDGMTRFSMEVDGVKRSASFGKGQSTFVNGFSGQGRAGITDSVRRLAHECRIELGVARDLLELP